MNWYWYVVLGVVGIGMFSHFIGSPNFWKLTRKHPERALQFFENNTDVWMVFYEKPAEGYSAHAPKSEWDGPFRISVPSVSNQLLVVYGRTDKYEASQKEFVRLSGEW